MRLKADLVLLLVAILWGAAFAAQRIAGLMGSVYFFNAARFLVGALCLLPFALRSRPTKGQILWSSVAGVILFVASSLQQIGLRTTAAGNAGFLTSLYVVFVPFVLFLGWKERLQALSVLAVFMAVLGSYLLSTGGRFQMHTGDLFELAGGLVWSVHVVLLGKFASRYDAVQFSAGQMLVCSASSWMAAALWETPSLPIDPNLLGSILFTAVVSLGLGYTLQVWGQRHTPPADAALILSLESVFAAVAGALVLCERLVAVQILGCVIIVVAVILSQARAWVRISQTVAAE